MTIPARAGVTIPDTPAPQAATFTITMPISELPTSNKREHWAVAARKRKAFRQRAAIECRRLPVFTGPVALDVTFQFPDRRVRDLDNPEIKGAIDGIVDARVVEDDSAQHITSVTRRGSPTPAPKGHVTLTFTLTAEGVNEGVS